MDTNKVNSNPHELSYDKIVKNILAESDEMTVRFINGLLNDNIPINAKVEWLDKESRGKNKNTGIVADFYPRIAGKLYAIEIEQDSRSGEIALRIFKYAIGGAMLHSSNSTRTEINITFPQPCVIFLKSTKNTPRELLWNVDFYDGQKITLKVPTIQLSELSIREIAKRNLLPIGQFYLRKFEKLTDKKADEFYKAAEELLLEIKAAVDNKLISQDIGKQMQETVQQTIENAIAKSKLTMEVRFKMTTNIKETLRYTNYPKLVREARESGKAEGIIEGEIKGKTAGIIEERINIARKALENDISISDISEITGLTVEEVEALRL